MGSLFEMEQKENIGVVEAFVKLGSQFCAALLQAFVLGSSAGPQSCARPRICKLGCLLFGEIFRNERRKI